ncbi:MAG TPA: NAD(P)H-dependent glycerol-3-phosphate dehydrogenase [Ktedonobacterales bacterium]|nr:NAD(P)H-dependent glycerol-3-phosphate dehydrogenase [Ktedonobacterales bacterium]
MRRVGVIGTGAWGTTLAILLANKGFETTLWEHRAERDEAMERDRENRDFLPDIPFPFSLRVTTKIGEAVEGRELVLLVTPAQRLRENVRAIASSVAPDAILLCGSKGLEIGSLKRMSEVMAEELPEGLRERIAMLSGPNIAREVAKGLPSAAVIAARDRAVAEAAREALNTATFRVYTSSDVIGVELSGALKNIIALGAGACDGWGYGENAKAAFMTRGLAEIARLGIACGANPLTFIGLAGMGDLIATCASPLSRNRYVGLEIAKGRKLDDVLAGMKSVAEGVTTTKAARELAERYGVEMPITATIYAVLFEGKNARQGVIELMLRDPKEELDGTHGIINS